jgi:pimeloyl-ACP methyl ester carboxylesterase
MTRVVDLTLDDGRTLRAYDTGRRDDGRLPLFWHHGTPNIGEPPRPLFAAADRLAMRWVSYDRPGYGGSTRHPGRDMSTAAADVVTVVDALGVDRFAVVGHSGGSSHALACAASLGERVVGAVSMAGLAPFGAEGLDWFAGMIASGKASLGAAAAGRQAKEAFETSGLEYDPEFTAADLATLDGAWSWLGSVVGPAVQSGPWGLVDDDLAYVSPWRCDPAQIKAPTLLLHGGDDGVVPSAHSEWLSSRVPGAELRVFAGDGHISVLDHSVGALEWLRDNT